MNQHAPNETREPSRELGTAPGVGCRLPMTACRKGGGARSSRAKATSRLVTDTPYELEVAGSWINVSLLPQSEQLSGSCVSSPRESDLSIEASVLADETLQGSPACARQDAAEPVIVLVLHGNYTHTNG